MVGGFLGGLGAGGLVGLTYTGDPAVGVLLGLIFGGIATGKVFLERADTWDEHSMPDTIGAVRPTAGFIGREARVVATIEAGRFGEISLRDDDGQLYGLAATADVDIAVDSAVTVIGTKGLDLVVTPRARS